MEAGVSLDASRSQGIGARVRPPAELRLVEHGPSWHDGCG